MEQEKRNIIIDSYPKSGSVWLSRLTAELVGCPFVGFWGLEDSYSFSEGTDRQSEFNCYQAHQLCSDLEHKALKDKVIYLLRDPRDIAISAIHHFKIGYKDIQRFLYLFPKGKKANYYLKQFLEPSFPNKLNRIIEMILFGDPYISKWSSVPWKAHIGSFLDKSEKEVLFLKYEDLLEDPYINSLNILNFLELKRSKESIEKAIYLQSFDYKKKVLSKNKNKHFSKHLRSGSSNYWQTELSENQKALFVRELEELLLYFNYEV